MIKHPSPDWLLDSSPYVARIEQCPQQHEIVLANGLIRRAFRTAPNFATIDLSNLTTGASLLRGVKPEAVVVLDGRPYEVGGLKGQPDYAYLDPEWLKTMTADPQAFLFTGLTTGRPDAPYPWSPRRHAPAMPWPPRGVSLAVEFRPPKDADPKVAGVTLSVHYEMYDHIPALAKWVTITNRGEQPVSVDGLESEVLAVNEQEKTRLHVESDYAFSGMNTTCWGPDPDYKSQVDYERRMPLLLTSRYPDLVIQGACAHEESACGPIGDAPSALTPGAPSFTVTGAPGVSLAPGEAFTSFRTFELLQDSDDRERRGLARRRLYRTLAPQVAECPVFMHVTSSRPEAVRSAIDQCANTGFEMAILSFGSGFNIESENPATVAEFKSLADYAHHKGIEIGGYTLMAASRDVGAENDCICPETGKPGSKFGQTACLASEWADGYFRRVLHFMDATGMDVIETDGPYHGDVCASTQHKHHRGLADSQLRQWQACVHFYRECRMRGIYVNSPDWYYLTGSNKSGMGYREDNFSLPRWRQILIARQNIYDGTFDKTPSMGWMHVPLVQYHGGGEPATIEPLSQHLEAYEWYLAEYFGSGVEAAYRGPRLYDTDATLALVRKWVSFYKRHRAILESDIIHVRRPDGRGIDCMLHVNPNLDERGLAMIYNPTDAAVTTHLKLPLYYTGLTDRASITIGDEPPVEYALDRACGVSVPVKLAPKGITWAVVRGAGVR